MYDEVKPLSKGAKLGLFVAFVVGWLVIGLGLRAVVGGFQKGGWGMWPILAVGIVAVTIIIERIRYLFFSTKTNRQAFSAEVEKHLMRGDVAGAVAFCQSVRVPLARIVGAGLATLGRPDDEVQDAVDDAALQELPRIEKRSGYLAMIGNIATLLGLLGTIIGLIKSFAGVSLSNVNDPATIEKARKYTDLVPACRALTEGKAIVACIDQNKSTILAQGISEAMNCTAFGLGVGITALLGYSILNGRTQHMLDEVGDGTVYLMNLAVGNRKAMKLS